MENWTNSQRRIGLNYKGNSSHQLQLQSYFFTPVFKSFHILQTSMTLNSEYKSTALYNK